ncbi:hypothetical protein SR882_04900 [Guyparkeria halophila]|uniref:Uncharacterized protein n=1 Tax=Guyparkeria halophila TaxID=47960 RepID=A0ABZ0YYY5_9GAMM|nr:hypothetical protein [Guyparkeria halophila]WQH17243.1 hypothetical protein SR882_04900 [Guyparkeria halophila]
MTEIEHTETRLVEIEATRAAVDLSSDRPDIQRQRTQANRGAWPRSWFTVHTSFTQLTRSSPADQARGESWIRVERSRVQSVIQAAPGKIEKMAVKAKIVDAETGEKPITG